MTPADLTPGIFTVTHPGYAPDYQALRFNLSVVSLYGVKGVAAFQLGGKPPRRGRHLLLTDSVLNWLSEISLTPTPRPDKLLSERKQP